MDLPIDVPIICADGSCGRSSALLINPVGALVTHLVVHEPGLVGNERIVPVAYVTDSTTNTIRLRCTRDALAAMPSFVTTHFVAVAPGFVQGSSTGVMAWPYASLPETIGIDVENIPPDELAVHRGSHVHATDGRIGEVESFLIDPTTMGITHLVLRKGHLWKRKDVTIPVGQIRSIADDNVFLTLDTHQIGLLPAIALQWQRPS